MQEKITQDRFAEKYQRMADMMVGNYEGIKNNLFLKAVNVKSNKELLVKMPHIKFGDIALTYRVVFAVTGNCVQSAAILSERFPEIGLNRLHKDTLKSSVHMFPPLLLPISEMLKHIFAEVWEGSEESEEILEGFATFQKEGHRCYILTNEKKLNGASALWYPGMLEEIYRVVGGDYRIIPTSIHELMILPKGQLSDKELKALLDEGNSQIVAPEEILSEQIWAYDGQEKVLRIVTDCSCDKAANAEKQEKM